MSYQNMCRQMVSVTSYLMPKSLFTNIYWIRLRNRHWTCLLMIKSSYQGPEKHKRETRKHVLIAIKVWKRVTAQRTKIAPFPTVKLALSAVCSVIYRCLWQVEQCWNANYGCWQDCFDTYWFQRTYREAHVGSSCICSANKNVSNP